MTENESLHELIVPLQNEQNTLEVVLCALQEQIKSADVELSALMATAERSPSAAAAVAASEKALLALQSMARHKQAVLTAVNTQLSIVLAALSEDIRTVRSVQLQNLLHEISVAAGAIDAQPMDSQLWALLANRVAMGQALALQAGSLAD